MIFFTNTKGGIIALPEDKKKRFEQSVCEDIMAAEDQEDLPPTLAYQTCLFNLCTAAEVVGATVTIAGTVSSFVPVLSGFSRAAEKAKDMIQEAASLTLKFLKMVLKAMKTLYKTERVYLRNQKIFIENPKNVIKAYLQNLALIWMMGPDVMMNAAFIYILKSFVLPGHQKISTGLLSRVQLACCVAILSIFVPSSMSQWEIPIGNLCVSLNNLGYIKAFLLAVGGGFVSVSNLGIDPSVERLSALANLGLTFFWGIPMYRNQAKVSIELFGCGTDNPFTALTIGINSVISNIYSIIPCGVMGEVIRGAIPEVPTIQVMDIEPSWCFDAAAQKTEEHVHSFFQVIIACYLASIVASQVTSLIRGRSWDLWLTTLTYTWIIRSVCASDLVLSMPYLTFKYSLTQPSPWEILTIACCLSSPIYPPLLSLSEQIEQRLASDDADKFKKEVRKALEKEENQEKDKKLKNKAANTIQAFFREGKARQDKTNWAGKQSLPQAPKKSSCYDSSG